ncbi:MAG: hypothetical protein IKN89_02435 [Oscillospiraceae bacterium]|nr:hypothetical protein [Oscillospiraceae bacterium]
MKKKCPVCGKEYRGREVYCGRCGALLEIEPNRCSANKTEYCRSARLDPEDRYCPFCREPSTYALKKKDGER